MAVVLGAARSAKLVYPLRVQLDGQQGVTESVRVAPEIRAGCALPDPERDVAAASARGQDDGVLRRGGARDELELGCNDGFAGGAPELHEALPLLVQSSD